MSVEGMYASIIGSNGADISAKGHALVEAKDKIESIGNDLKGHVGRTKWVGEGGDAFREWGDAFAKQVIKLAHVAGVTGDHMVHAGDTIKAAAETMRKEAPASSMGMCFADADKEKARIKAMEELKEKVLPQMRTAASACRVAANDIGGLETPQFRPMPAAATGGSEDGWLTPYEPSDGSSSGGAGGVQPAGNAGVSGVGADANGAGRQTSGVARPDAPQEPSHVPTHGSSSSGDTSGSNSTPSHDNNAGTRVDSTQAPPMPAPTTPSGPSTPPAPEPSHHGTGPTTPVPPPPLPPTSRGTGETRRIPGSRGGGPEPLPNRSGVERSGGQGGPGRIGGTGRVKVPPVPRVDTGVIGGVPSPGQQASTPSRGVSRGTVIGGEAQQTGRGMMGTGTPGSLGPGVSRGIGGTTRRFASEPGGMVNAPSGSQGARREFTPGGSGLLRGGNAGGVSGVPMGATQGVQRGVEKNRNRSNRPGYLTEDEETWNAGGAGNVPPVVQ
ncbi:hypothetical protein I5Q34_07160 [Streptomyces sp. AV19]|uniref:WXG100 family type VII secretion target n=1 Tax=Streptomyces sp. AV19 TaxID=2793068 RepID=UPI0018FE594F|nr:hypothetical protein [Streptomyces sp. AV19]MBH1934073.1 hypothetical protein [Streptomyces sp. AV19]MDG4535446.1 hypothetical protein [Streptomyces sp. AV19]